LSASHLPIQHTFFNPILVNFSTIREPGSGAALRSLGASTASGVGEGGTEEKVGGRLGVIPGSCPGCLNIPKLIDFL
jgi:hypothetical protein